MGQNTWCEASSTARHRRFPWKPLGQLGHLSAAAMEACCPLGDGPHYERGRLWASSSCPPVAHPSQRLSLSCLPLRHQAWCRALYKEEERYCELSRAWCKQASKEAARGRWSSGNQRLGVGREPPGRGPQPLPTTHRPGHGGGPGPQSPTQTGVWHVPPISWPCSPSMPPHTTHTVHTAHTCTHTCTHITCTDPHHTHTHHVQRAHHIAHPPSPHTPHTQSPVSDRTGHPDRVFAGHTCEPASQKAPWGW